MTQIVSLSGTREKTLEYLEGLVGTEPRLVRILPEDAICGKESVFVGENNGVYEFVEGWSNIESYKSNIDEMTFNDHVLMLRAFNLEIYPYGSDEYQQARAKMEATDYFEMTGL